MPTFCGIDRILLALDDVAVNAVFNVGTFVGFCEQQFLVSFIFGEQQGYPGIAVKVVVLHVLNQVGIIDMGMHNSAIRPGYLGQG